MYINRKVGNAILWGAYTFVMVSMTYAVGVVIGLI